MKSGLNKIVLKCIKCSLVMCLWSIQCDAWVHVKKETSGDNDPPVISSFSPTSGPVGTVVTITGVNFDSTPSNNIVFFGATRANVTAASSTELTVVVPSGSTYKPISVTVDDLLARSSTPFITSSDDEILHSQSFAITTYEVEDGASELNIEDMNLDGLPDISLTHWLSTEWIVFQNQTTNDHVFDFEEKSFFSAKRLFSITADMDGDGLKDLVTLDYSGSILTVLRNNSTTGGEVSFDTGLDFDTEQFPLYIDVADLDQDGKLDVVIANNNLAGSISVFRNTTEAGSGMISFADRINFSTDEYPSDLKIGDIDGDGRLDVVVRDKGPSSRNLSIFRNNSTEVGNISFETKLDFGSNYYGLEMVLVDLNEDDKLEIVSVNELTNSVSILENTSSAPASISFADQVDFDCGTLPSCLRAADLDGDGFIDLVVTNETGNSVSILQNAYNGGGIAFDSQIVVDLEEANMNPAFIALGDINGDDRTDMVVSNYDDASISVFTRLSSKAEFLGFGFTSEVESATIDTDFHTVSIKVAYGTDLSSLIPTFTLSDGATASIGSTAQSSGVTSNDYSSSVTYTITAEDVVTIQDWEVTVTAEALNTATDITSFSFTDETGAASIDSDAHTVSIEVAYDTDLSSLVPTFALSDGATASIRSTIQESGLTSNDYSSSVTYTITAEDGITTQDWEVTVTEALNTATDITSFSFTDETGAASIDSDAHTVSIEVAYDTDLSSLVPTFALSDGSTASIGSTAQSSGVTSNDYSSSVTYTITAEDGVTTQDWEVTVTEALNTATDITSFSFTDETGAASIDSDAHTVSIEVSYGTDLSSLIPTFTLSDGATASIGSTAQSSGVTINDYSSSVTYTVTAQDGITTQDWEVTASEALNTATDITSFSFTEQTEAASIDASSYTVSIEVSYGTGLSALVSSFALSDGATASIGSTIQESGLTSNDYSSSVTYTITAEDGITTQDWVINAMVAESNIPAIDSFFPQSGSVGTVVSISGSNFSNIPSENTVRFGAFKAEVLEAFQDVLFVVVPIGAAYDPISVSANGLHTFSQSKFILTFDGAGLVSNPWFETAEVYDVEKNPRFVSICDFNSDDSHELVVAAAGSNSVSIFQNSQPFGMTPDLTNKYDFSVGAFPYAFTIKDFSGDEKMDIVTVNRAGNSISVLRNEGLETISFDDHVEYEAGTSPFSVVSGDLNLDGLNDLVVANSEDNSISVFRNVSSGNGEIRFAEQILFETASSPRSVAIADFDGDGKLDLALACRSDDVISILLNNGVPGSDSISFSSKVDFPTFETPNSVSLADFDADGDSDIAVISSESNSVSIFENTSILGVISFSQGPNILSIPDAFFVSTGDIDGDGMIDLVTANNSSGTLSIFRNTGSEKEDISFEKIGDYDSGNAPRALALGDLNGDSKTDIVAANWYGNSVSYFDNSLLIPSETTSIDFLTSSRDILDYSIISIPYQTQKISDVFKNLGSWSHEEMNLAKYDGGDSYQFYPADFENFEPGVGYWFLTSRDSKFLLNGGYAVGVTYEEPFSISLKANNWNMIGNPYLKPVDWQQVADFNRDLGVEVNDLVFFKERQFQSDETVLDIYEGALLYSPEDVEIKIPITAMTNSSERVSSKNEELIDFGYGSWIFDLMIHNDYLRNDVAAVSMQPSAANGKDPYDWKQLPRLSQYLDLSFEGGFSKSAVPSQDQYTWSFSANSSSVGEMNTLSWDGKSLQKADYGMFLLDVPNQKLTDMSENSSYSFINSNQQHDFKLFFSLDDQIQEYLVLGDYYVGDPYPNPFSKSFLLPLSVNQPNTKLQLDIINILGKKIYQSLYDLSSGYQKIEIDLKNHEMTSGTYLLQITLQDGSNTNRFNKRIVYEQ